MFQGDVEKALARVRPPGTAAFTTPTVAGVAARDGFAAAAARGESDSSRAEARHASAGAAWDESNRIWRNQEIGIYHDLSINQKGMN